MKEAFEQIWGAMGIPQVWGGVLTILLLGIAFLLKKLIGVMADKYAADRKTLNAQFADIGEFVKIQSVALIKAYVRIFEGEDALDAEGKRFSALVEKADNELMKPLRQFEAKLDDDTKNKIFYVHNILAQFYPDASTEAIKSFKSRKGEFYRLIDGTIKALRPDLILNRLGVVSQPLKGRGKV
jgi:hypothetical protein